jgi:membrane associated rhomboid family serine protease
MVDGLGIWKLLKTMRTFAIASRAPSLALGREVTGQIASRYTYTHSSRLLLRPRGSARERPATLAGTPSSLSRADSDRAPDGQEDNKNGVFGLLLINFGIHVAATTFLPSLPGMLALSHYAPKWWQFVTAAFVHANWDHLFGNAFSLLVFGRMVEEEEGAFGLMVTYLVCGIAGNIASYLSSPNSATVSLGASSAVFGLFAVGVLTKVRLDVRRLLEAAVLGAYVWRQVMTEVVSLGGGGATVGGMSVGHWAHLGGALGGVALVLLLSRLPKVDGY